MTPVEVLTRARELIAEPSHWCQGHFHAGNAYCSAGALLYTTRNEDEESRAYEFLLSAAGQRHSISGWNDHPDRTHAEVLAAFDRAIELASLPSSLPSDEKQT